MLNFVIEHKLNLLSENSFNQENSNNIKMLNYEDRKNNEEIPGLGEISLINNQEDYSISIKNNEPLIIISGWIQGENNEEISDVFLLIDEKPFVKGNLHNSDQMNLLHKGSWTTSFFSGYLEEGCHNIQVIGISIEKTIFLKDQRQICIIR